MSERSLGRRGFMKRAAGSALLAPALARTASAQATQSAPAPAAGYPKRPEKKKALFVYGGWPGHEPTKCRDIFVPWLRANGFEVTVSDTQAPYADAALMSTIDLVTQVWTMGTIEKEPLKGLRMYGILRASQPINVLTPMTTRVTVIKRAPASAGGNARRGAGSIGGEHSGAAARAIGTM